ncbi:hypothetical protein HDV57DRAFT_484606 [Trichoderma longibrachiatum]|uniref:Uncharacterized protein n=1 Tax=Trichoderma longibrachiatum ATCC 18648 TaxID=983965 RepID=A0A2T4CDK7_TRILO|nr:hypothetical protein M440DRAFT_1327114 [Trichoderma longibrachiatum ATCC 18648]
MPGRVTLSRSSNSPDPASTVLEAEKLLRKIKKDRIDGIRAVMADAEAALAEVRERVTSWQLELQQQREKRRLDCVTKLIELEDRKDEIENKMGDIGAKAHAMVEDLEAMMMAGYEGREKDATLALEKMTLNRES